MQDRNFKELFQKYLDETISPEEFEQLDAFIRENYAEQQVEELWEKALTNRSYLDTGNAQDLDVIFREITARKPARLRWIKYAAAAAVIILVATGGIMQLFLQTEKPDTPTIQTVDIAPGTNKAILTLGDGSVITLDSAGNQVIQQGGTVVKQSGGQLSYEAESGNTAISFNTLATPRGGQFQVRLPDGTKVWLNAASTLRYPTAFVGKERKVEVTGEAYFEVAKNTEMPFRVEAMKRVEIEVLGTHFNVNTYEVLSTTLLEGAVKITDLQFGNHMTLKPGEQAQLLGEMKVVNCPDPGKILAWKNGLFNFEGASFKEVMRELERWYDIEVIYKGDVPDIHFGGELSRNKSLAGLIEALRDAEVHFQINGRQLIITH